MLDFCVIGSGISGSTIAYLLSKKFSVEVFDKAKGSGGRACNKKIKKNLSFDHGTQYISPSTASFKKFVSKLKREKILKTWDGKHLDLTFKKTESKEKLIGVNGNNAISKFHLKRIKQSYNSPVKTINFNKFFWEITFKNNKKVTARSVIITCPFPQLKKLAKKFIIKKFLNLNVRMKPNITTMIAIRSRNQVPISSIKFDDSILAWAANENSKKRFLSSQSLWTLQSTVNWAKKKINIYKKSPKVENDLIKRFFEYSGYKKNNIIFKKTHGWKYSYNSNSTIYKSYWDKNLRIGVCADWLIGPKVESAWLSANDLYKKIQKKSPR